ncbi:MAG: TolC family protein [Cyanobium sp. LacPavin_0920_WC12_MAG_62_9]|nr:TolC family protein [Cyanobium sp. LacPavin_0920_WC12_MAG_62_9]
MRRFSFSAALIGLTGLPLAALAAAPAATTTKPALSTNAVPVPKPEHNGGPAAASIPLAPAVLGPRPRLNPKVEPSAATKLSPGISDLSAPNSLALPTKPEMVRIQQLRPLGLTEILNLAEVNNPNLKAIGSQVDQAKSNLRAQLAQWYPTLSLGSNTLPSYAAGQNYTSGSGTSNINRSGFDAALEASYALINPRRVPLVAAARDQYEKAKFQYVVSLRDLRLQAAQAYFDLQQADDQVRIGQESVRASLVSLRDSKARFQAGVATKLEVLEAETQLARDQQLLANGLAAQSVARRALAGLLDLPFTVTPTAKDSARVMGVWNASLSESIVAAFSFREELDQAILDISIANSQANAALAAVQPFLNIFTTFTYNQDTGSSGSLTGVTTSGYNYETRYGVNLSWSIFDGGAAAASSRQAKQLAQQNRYQFSQRRDAIRQEVETSFYELEKNNRDIITTSREVISAREALRLARLRFQAGVTTQREVVDNQRDLTNAEVRYSNSVTDYNKRLVELSRRTGLNQVMSCSAPSLSAVKPAGASDVPVEPTPLIPACRAAASGAVF